MVEPGLYRHKSGNLYRVLFTASWTGPPPTPDALLVVTAEGVGDPPDGMMCVQVKSAAVPPFDRLFDARWSGNTNDVTGHFIVIYVALYGEGRIAARTEKEFVELTDVRCDRRDHHNVGEDHFLRRFERIGD